MDAWSATQGAESTSRIPLPSSTGVSYCLRIGDVKRVGNKASIPAWPLTVKTSQSSDSEEQ